MENKRCKCLSMHRESTWQNMAQHQTRSSGQLSPPTGLALWKSLKNRNKNKNSKVLSQVKLLSQNFRIGQICELIQPAFPAKPVANHHRSSPLVTVHPPKMSESRHYYGSSYNSSNEVYLGFDNLRNQVHRKSAKKGFDFTLCLVGRFGGEARFGPISNANFVSNEFPIKSN